jgi:hypothetical protein
MKPIFINTIPYDKQRYPTCGDYYQMPCGIVINVSELGDWRYEFLIAVHELIEWGLCKYKKISDRDIDKFDKSFEEQRLTNNNNEPGDDLKSPYKFQHSIANGVERILAAYLHVDWKVYNDKVNSL